MTPERYLQLRLDPSLALDLCGLHRDPWQVEFLRRGGHREVLNIARQSGKSQTVAVRAALELVMPSTRPRLTACWSPSQSQSGELLQKIRGAALAIDPDVDLDSDSATALKVKTTGSRAISLPATEASSRGWTPNLVLLDEVARLPDSLYHEVAVPATAATAGDIIMLSTPRGRRGVFSAAYHGDLGDEWTVTKATVYDNPRVSPAWIAKTKATTPPWVWRQEYLCQFVTTDNAALDADQIERAFSENDFRPLFGGV